jgi:hypothetical protein
MDIYWNRCTSSSSSSSSSKSSSSGSSSSSSSRPSQKIIISMPAKKKDIPVGIAKYLESMKRERRVLKNSLGTLFF